MSDNITARTTGTEIAQDRGEHYIEESVSIYLMRDTDGSNTWVLDPTTVFGGPLDSNYDNGPVTANCECDHPDECARAAAQMLTAPMPDGEDLLHMLAAALGFDVRRIS